MRSRRGAIQIHVYLFTFTLLIHTLQELIKVFRALDYRYNIIKEHFLSFSPIISIQPIGVTVRVITPKEFSKLLMSVFEPNSNVQSQTCMSEITEQLTVANVLQKTALISGLPD